MRSKKRSGSPPEERKRGKEQRAALEKSEERFRQIFDNSNDAIYLVGPPQDGRAGRFMTVNRKAVAMLGYSRQEFLDMTPADIHDPGTLPDIGVVQERLSRGEAVVFQTRHRAKDGRLVPVELSSYQFMLGTDRVNLVIARDITGRKKAEEELKKSERRFFDIINFLPDATFAIDNTGRVIAWNRAIEEMTGVPADAMLGKGEYAYAIPFYGERRPILIDLVLMPEDRIRESRYHVIRKEGNVLIAETELVRPDGTTLALWGKATPLTDEQGNLTGAIESIRDITALQLAERVLKESEDRYRALFENSGSPLMIVDEDTTIMQVNREFEVMTGYTRGEIAGRRSWTEFIADPADLEQMKEYHRLRRVDPGAVPSTYESRIIDRDGAIRNVIVTSAMIPGTRQSLAALVDITARKKAEEELRALYAGLEQRVLERTEDLRLAEESTRRANEKLNLLSSITRHDILNQLMVLKGYMELAGGNGRDTAAGEYLSKARHAAGVIEQLILFTRLYQDIGVKSPQWQDVGRCAKRPAAELLPASVAFVADIPATEIFADQLFEKVLYTLMDNSIRHGGTVTGIRLTLEKTASGSAVLCYEDNGCGIPAAEKERIFVRGFGKHTGLGLFLAREILAITGITIAETGTPGKGARFGITVPEGKWRPGNDRG